MAHQIQEAHTVSSPSTPPSRRADTARSEHEHLQALRRRLEAAAEGLSRVRDQLQARAPGYRGWDEDREPIGIEGCGLDPEGGRQ
jgi:hypothetical protein